MLYAFCDEYKLLNKVVEYLYEKLEVDKMIKSILHYLWFEYIAWQ